VIAVRRTVDRFGFRRGITGPRRATKNRSPKDRVVRSLDSGFADWPVVGPMDAKLAASGPRYFKDRAKVRTCE
jgi:hypothetical protein